MRGPGRLGIRPQVSREDFRLPPGLYDYQKHAINKGMFRDTQERGQAVFREYSPPFGGIVGRHMHQDAVRDRRCATGPRWEQARLMGSGVVLIRGLLSRRG